MCMHVNVCLCITHTCMGVRLLICPFCEQFNILEQLAEDVGRNPLFFHLGEVLNLLN